MTHSDASALNLQLENIPESHKQRLLDIKKRHFKSAGFQGVESDDLIFLIGELHRFYFPSEQNVGYTIKGNTTT